MGSAFRATEDGASRPEAGLEDNRYDYLTALAIAPSRYFTLTNRLRLDRNKFSLRRNEIYLSIGPANLRFDTSYVSLERDQTVDELGAREELSNAWRWKIDQRWIATAESRRDLSQGGTQIRSSAGIQYLDECIGFGLTIERNFTRDRDVEPSTSLRFRFLLQNLG